MCRFRVVCQIEANTHLMEAKRSFTSFNATGRRLSMLPSCVVVGIACRLQQHPPPSLPGLQRSILHPRSSPSCHVSLRRSSRRERKRSHECFITLGTLSDIHNNTPQTREELGVFSALLFMQLCDSNYNHHSRTTNPPTST